MNRSVLQLVCVAAAFGASSRTDAREREIREADSEHRAMMRPFSHAVAG